MRDNHDGYPELLLGLITFEQIARFAATYHARQPPALASLGGSHGELRRVDAEAT